MSAWLILFLQHFMQDLDVDGPAAVSVHGGTCVKERCDRTMRTFDLKHQKATIMQFEIVFSKPIM